MLDSNARPKFFSKLSLQSPDVWIFCGGDAFPCPFGLELRETLHGPFGLPHAPAFLHDPSCECQLVLSRFDRQQCASVPHVERPLHQKLLDGIWKLEQAQEVADRDTGPANDVRGFFVGHLELIH